ncbi:MAG: DUF6428 family protein [Saprospiraceae bacterium]
MNVSALKNFLTGQDHLTIRLPGGELVPSHFHVTEVGAATKHFIDCGGTIRSEKRVNLQLWSATDYDHRLHPTKLVDVIELAEAKLGLEDWEVEVEYQGKTTIEKFSLAATDGSLKLVEQLTTCLAPDQCNVKVPAESRRPNMIIAQPSCTPGSGCC